MRRHAAWWHEWVLKAAPATILAWSTALAATASLAALAPGGGAPPGGPCGTEPQAEFASTASPDDHFGTAVAIDGDLMAVGAEWDSPAGFHSGSAFVFVNAAAEQGAVDYVQVQHIIANDPGPLDEFGSSIDLRGNRMIVGAAGDALGRGSAYVYQSAPFWTFQVKLAPSDGAAGDGFGTSVSIDGDVAAVGAPGADEADLDAGAAYAYRRSPDGIWQEHQKLLASDTAADDRFGRSIAVSGDLLVIGKGGANGVGGPDTVHVFRYMTIWDAWLPIQILSGGDRFGWSLALRGDVLIVGSETDGAAAYAGGAVIFRWTGDFFVEEAPLNPCDGNGNRFGWSVDIEGDRAVVGAFGDEEMAGAAYVYQRIGSRWSERGKVHPPERVAPGMMGFDVALARPIINKTLLAAGAPMDSVAAPGAGAVHAFLLCPPCLADTNADSSVDVLDLVGVILQWGECAGPCCHGDVNGDSMVDVLDLVELVLAWGPC
jgi:hypothetical protein